MKKRRKENFNMCLLCFWLMKSKKTREREKRMLSFWILGLTKTKIRERKVKHMASRIEETRGRERKKRRKE